jgi:hypothetical protein
MFQIGCILFAVIGIAQIVLGVMGLQHQFGGWVAFFAVLAAVGFRFMLPLTVGTYFGAVEVLGWPWWGGVLIAAPGLLLIIPSVIAQVTEALSSMARR